MRWSILNKCDSLPAEEQDILRYLPKVETPGFKLASFQAFQLLVALPLLPLRGNVMQQRDRGLFLSPSEKK